MPDGVRLRSPLLRPLAEWRDADTPRIVRRRRFVMTVILALIAAIVLLTRAGQMPAAALDVWAVLHDYLVLPIWGYTWTLLAPYSIAWWSLAGIAAVVWLVTFATRWSAVRGFHARLCRILIVHVVANSDRSPRYVAHLTAWVNWLEARKFGAEILRDVVRLEQAEALAMVVDDGSRIDEHAAGRLVRLTDLLARLTSCTGAPARERWRALALWHECVLWLEWRTGSRAGWSARLFDELAATGRALIDRLPDDDVVEGDVLSDALRRDLARVVAGESGDFLFAVLVRLDELWALAQQGSRDDGEDETLNARASDEVLEVQGLLISSLGLHAAARMEDAQLAAAHLHAFEAISFVGYLGVLGREGSRVARALTALAPAREHYCLAAALRERHRASQSAGPAVGGAVLDEADRHERTEIDSLYDASASRLHVPVDRGPIGRLRRRIRERPLPLRRRIDPILLGGLTAAALVYGAATAAVVLMVESYLPGWSARALPDRRLLDNVRRGLDTMPFLDAVFHAPDRQLIVSQAGGVLHSFDPATGLWSTARPFGPNDLARPDIRLLASSHDGSADALWGVTADGGLVRRRNGRWTVVVGDTKFLSRRGTPVQQAGLATVAASPDGKWLLAAAGSDGLGLQDLERRRWLSRDEIVQDESPSAVTHAAWWRDRFYVGGPEGVSELSLNQSALLVRRVKGLEGAVVALEATAANGLFVLATARCENGAADCIRLRRMRDSSSSPEVLIDERNRYPELSLDRLFYATQWKEHLLLAGGSGIFDYDERLHAWNKRASETITAIGPCAASQCFYYGYGGRSSGVALLTREAEPGVPPRRWTLAGEQPTRIAAAASGKAAVLTAAGRGYALAAGSVSTPINPAGAAPVPIDRYRGAVTFGDKVLFFGPSGALLHDVVRRSYSPFAAVPQWLRSPASVVVASGASLFGLVPRGSSHDAYVIPQQEVELGTLFFNTSKPFRIDGPIRAIDSSAPDVLRVIDGQGRVQSIAPSGVTPLTGGALPATAGTRLLDVAATRDQLATIAADGVRVYSMQTRSWSDPLPAPAGERAVEIAARESTWIARSAANRLVTIGVSPSVLIGGGASMPRAQPTDARQIGSDIYLSWPGVIQRYDTRSRQITATWTSTATAPTRLAAVIGDMWPAPDGTRREYFEASPLASLMPRTVAEAGPLRLTRRADGTLEGAFRVADLQGSLSWLPFDLSGGRFPFDVVRSIAVVAGTLYVGTDAGLQIYDGTDLSLGRAALVTLAPGPSAASPAIDRVGEPCTAPGIVTVCGPRGCARKTAPGFVSAPPDALSCTARVQSSFWSWQMDASGVSGRYTGVAPVRHTPFAAPPIVLSEGRFPHDRIEQIVSSGGSTFTVWQGRYVDVHAAGPALAGGRTHAFDLPIQLVRVTAPTPMLRARDRDLAPGLYAIEGPGSRMWRYEDQAWTIVTDGAETAAIADCATTPPLLQHKRLRLVQHATDAAPVFETRMPGGTWTPLAWDASLNRYAVDVWQDIAVQQQVLWTATPAGLVSRDGNWLFNPDGFRVVSPPSAEASRVVTDLRTDGGVADVRYDGARVYRIPLDSEASVPLVPLNDDPFAEQAFDVDTKYWRWRISGRTGASAGRLVGTWHGEPIAMVNGRFDFDAINSIAVFQDRLHVASDTRGWFALPVDSAALDGRVRPEHGSISPLDVTRLYANRDPDEPELCLQGADGQFARLAPDGASRRTQGCPVLAARTGFWRYVRDGWALRVLPAAGAARPGERRLVDGRFTDEVITGAPVTGNQNGRPFMLVPTAAAVMWWDASGHVANMHAPPFQGKPDVPRLLQWTAGGSPAYVADGTLYSLEDDEKPRGSWTVRLPPKAVFERLTSGPGPLLAIDWSDDGRRHHSVVDPRNGSIAHDDLPIDARTIPAYFQRAMTERSRDGLIRLRLRDHIVSAYATNEGWPIVEVDDSFELLAGIPYGSRAILVGPHHLVEINMERVARAVYSGQSPPPVQPRSDKK